VFAERQLVKFTVLRLRLTTRSRLKINHRIIEYSPYHNTLPTHFSRPNYSSKIVRHNKENTHTHTQLEEKEEASGNRHVTDVGITIPGILKNNG
jgi:hypothetical protein